MEERQTQIVEGAGLEESRVNREFIDFLQKWSSPVLFVLAALFLGWWLWTRHVEKQAERRGDAFRELDALRVAGNASPDSLRGIAEEYSDVKGVPEQARLAAADEYMRAVRRGIFPGSELNPDGTLQFEDDAMSEDDRVRFLGEARALYAEVETSARKQGMDLLRFNALSGLAAVAESTGDAEVAREYLEDLASAADAASFDLIAEGARRRLASLGGGVVATPTLYAVADLPPDPDAPPPPPEVTDDGAAADGASTEEPAQAGDATNPEGEEGAEGGSGDEPAPTDPAASDDPPADPNGGG